MILKNTCRWCLQTNCLIALLLMLALVFTSCEKDDGPAFSVVPEIELVAIAPDTVVEFSDVLVITISYKDGDGDIGHQDPDINSIFVRDARLEDYDGFYIGPIAPIGEEVAITGQLDIEFPALFRFGNSSSENTFFYIYIEDRTGNQSNEIITPEVTIVAE